MMNYMQKRKPVHDCRLKLIEYNAQRGLHLSLWLLAIPTTSYRNCWKFKKKCFLLKTIYCTHIIWKLFLTLKYIFFKYPYYDVLSFFLNSNSCGFCLIPCPMRWLRKHFVRPSIVLSGRFHAISIAVAGFAEIQLFVQVQLDWNHAEGKIYCSWCLYFLREYANKL